jgi:microcystin-dependent protein
MAEPFLSEIRMFSIAYAPSGWALCNGQLLPINQNQALFSLLGTTYGGNGQTNFALPDLRDRVPIHEGGGFTLGQAGGQDAHTLTIAELPQHVHVANAKAPADGAANTNNPSGAFLSNSAPNEIYQAGGGNQPLIALNPATVANVGGSQPHENRQPYLTISFCIALQGIFPSQT